MAAPSWRTLINKHPTFKRLSEINQKSASTDSKNILAVIDDVIFTWSETEQNIVTVNLTTLGQNDAPSQVLIPANPPEFIVNSIEFNRTVRLVALVGKQGITVVTIPERWGKHGLFGGGKEEVTCRTVEIGERFFVCNSHLQVLQVSWHPGSVSDSHLLVLCSDNYLRTYDVSSPQIPEQVFQLGRTLSHNITSSTKLSFLCALGDTAVSFTFGPATELPPANPSLKPLEDQETSAINRAWPIFILRGNGDVYIAWSSLYGKRSNRPSLQGPLTMYPPADDNYGVDACDVLCIATTPPILTIATCSGRLHHCVLLESNKDEEDEEQTDKWSDSWTQQSFEVMPSNLPKYSLYVYESVEMELILAPSVDQQDEEYSCPIRLHADPTTEIRYHCSHAAGVHAVALPLVPHLQQFAELTDDASSGFSLGPDQACIVEHLVCTKPLPSSPPAPILGLAVVNSHLLGSTLVCLTSSFEPICLPLLYTYGEPISVHCLGVEGTTTDKGNIRSGSSFEQHIRQLLRRTSSNPLLRSCSGEAPGLPDVLQLLTRATHVMRAEYVSRQELARLEIERRVKKLMAMKVRQLREIQDIGESKKKLTSQAHDLADKYEEVQDNQNQLITRVETLLLKIQRRVPVISNSERSMLKDLQLIQVKLNDLKNSVLQVKVKSKYQDRSTNESQENKTMENAGLAVNTVKPLHQALTKEGASIQGLIKKTNMIKKELAL